VVLFLLFLLLQREDIRDRLLRIAGTADLQRSTAALDDAATVATSQAKAFGTELENMARRNPLGTIAGAVIVGVLIGMMGRRS
jgi:ElaB/YqjD/DUF883 family membrane-anchored ribosome-binding protein